MVRDILDLPIELQEIIYSYFSSQDTVNFACTSKEYYRSVRHLLWKEIDIPWKCIQKNSEFPKDIEKLKLTTELSFIDNYDNDNVVPKPTKWSHVSSNYKRIIKNCNPNKLTRLKIEGLIADSGIKLTCNYFENLKELCLDSCHYTTIVTWRELSNLSSLKQLTIRDCKICNWGVKTVCESKSLTELHLIQCQFITDACMEHIGNMDGLKRLSVSYNQNITANGLRCLGNLQNLSRLNLEYSDVDGEGMTTLCHLVLNLKRLDVNGCRRLTVTGFYQLASLPTLEGVKVQDNNFSDLAMEHFCQLKGMKENIDSDDLVLTIKEDTWPKNGKCGMLWEYSCLI